MATKYTHSLVVPFRELSLLLEYSTYGIDGQSYPEKEGGRGFDRNVGNHPTFQHRCERNLEPRLALVFFDVAFAIFVAFLCAWK